MKHSVPSANLEWPARAAPPYHHHPANVQRVGYIDAPSSSYSSTPPERSSYCSIPQSSVPRRTSSHHRSLRRNRSGGRKPSPDRPPPPSLLLPPSTRGFAIPNRGHSQSPVKEAGLRADAVTSETARRAPSQTHVRSPPPLDILDFPQHKHPRLSLELHVSAPLFVGGGSIEGHVRVLVDANERNKQRPSLSIGAVSVDLLGVEEAGGTRKATFLALGTQLVDAHHPPPSKMIHPPNPLFGDTSFWLLVPSDSTLPFLLSLPLDTGPPPFKSKSARIRFVLCVTALVRDAGKLYQVRTCQDVHVLPTLEPEEALVSLPSPLTACDELTFNKAGLQASLRITAGLHRQVWVSGNSVFVDVHVSNKCRKSVRRLELSVERDLLYYRHAAATTLDRPVGQARIFESNDQSTIVQSCFKLGSTGWNGIDPHTSEMRTYELEIPRGHATVRCGKYFEVRYFLNVSASLSTTKVVSVQLPITLIHMNSLDVVPNSVAQVAAAIEEERANRELARKNSRSKSSLTRQRSTGAADVRRRPSFSQGQAFTAPRLQSLDRQREQRGNLDELRDILDASPRRRARQNATQRAMQQKGSNTEVRPTRSLGRPSNSHETFDGGPSPSIFTPMFERSIPNARPYLFNENRDPLRRMYSFDSARTKRSITPRQVVHMPGPATYGRMEMPGERAGSAMSFRDKLDRGRAEVKAVGRKASGGLKERSMNWWDQCTGRDKAKEGWI